MPNIGTTEHVFSLVGSMKYTVHVMYLMNNPFQPWDRVPSARWRNIHIILLLAIFIFASLLDNSLFERVDMLSYKGVKLVLLSIISSFSKLK